MGVTDGTGEMDVPDRTEGLQISLWLRFSTLPGVLQGDWTEPYWSKCFTRLDERRDDQRLARQKPNSSKGSQRRVPCSQMCKDPFDILRMSTFCGLT